MEVKAEVLPPETDCHHFVLEDDWTKLEEPYGSISQLFLIHHWLQKDAIFFTYLQPLP
ncbi:hypothetical protein EV1_008809 [Malus domestica]